MIKKSMLFSFICACALLFSCGTFSPVQKFQMASTAGTIIRAGITLAQMVSIMGAPDSAQTLRFRDPDQRQSEAPDTRSDTQSHWIYKNVVIGVKNNKVVFIIDCKTGKKVKTYSPFPQ